MRGVCAMRSANALGALCALAVLCAVCAFCARCARSPRGALCGLRALGALWALRAKVERLAWGGPENALVPQGERTVAPAATFSSNISGPR